MNKSKIIIFIFTLILVFTSIFLYSCEYHDSGLLTIDDEAGSINVEEKIEDSGVSDREFFLESKEKQKNNPLDDINIRKAIFYAIDRQRIANELLGEYGEVLSSLFEKDSYYYYPAWSEYDYDINNAKEYLSKAGYSIDNPLYIYIGANSDKSSEQIIEDIIKEDLDKIGIKLWIFNKPSKEWYQDYVLKGDYELGLFSINFDVNSLINSFSSTKIPPMETEQNKKCLNFYWYNNPDADEVLNKIVNEKDTEVKKDLLDKLQDILVQDAVILPLYSRSSVIAYNKNKLEQIDVSIINNQTFFNMENWILSGEENVDENSENEIIIGYEGEDYELSGPFDFDYINDLLVRGLWRIDEKGDYEAVFVEEDDYLEKNTDGIPDLEIN